MSRTIDAPPDVVFRATVDVLTRWGFPIETADPEGGRVVTRRRPVHVPETRRRVEKVDVSIRDVEDGSRIQMLLVFVDQASGTGDRRGRTRGGDDAYEQSVSAGAAYDDYLDAVEDRVREMQRDSTGTTRRSGASSRGVSQGRLDVGRGGV